jgi:hypothetical protein
VTVIGAPTTTVDAVPVPRLATWPTSSDPFFSMQPGGFKVLDSQEWILLAGTVATGTRIVPPSGHRPWTSYRDTVPGHIWSFQGLDACSLGIASWSSGATVPPNSLPVVNLAATILACAPDGTPWFKDNAVIEGATQLCVLPRLLPRPLYHGLPMGQIFSTDLGADGFVAAIDSMAPGLSTELGYVSHAWFQHWLDIAQSCPATLQTDCVAHSDIQESLVLSTNPDSLFPYPFSRWTMDLCTACCIVIASCLP